MTGGWRILDLTGLRGALDVDRGGLVVFDGETAVDRVPAADVAVVLLGTGVTFTSGVLHRLAAHGAVMMLTDWTGTPQSVALPWSSHSRIAERQSAQAVVGRERNDDFWTQIVTAKIFGQAATLATRKPRVAKKLRALGEQVEPGDSGGAEATAAQFYFRKMWGKEFVRDHDGGDIAGSGIPGTGGDEEAACRRHGMAVHFWWSIRVGTARRTGGNLRPVRPR